MRRSDIVCIHETAGHDIFKHVAQQTPRYRYRYRAGEHNGRQRWSIVVIRAPKGPCISREVSREENEEEIFSEALRHVPYARREETCCGSDSIAFCTYTANATILLTNPSTALIAYSRTFSSLCNKCTTNAVDSTLSAVLLTPPPANYHLPSCYPVTSIPCFATPS